MRDVHIVEKFSRTVEGIFSPKYYSSSCFFTLCKLQKGTLRARSFKRRIVSSFGGIGGSSSLTTPLFFRDVEEKAVMLVVCDGQVIRLLVFIRYYCMGNYSKRVPPRTSTYYAYIEALILLLNTLFDPISA